MLYLSYLSNEIQSKAFAVLLIATIAGLGLGFGFHVFDGFRPFVIYEDVFLGNAQTSYSLRAHFDKALAGLILMGWLYRYKPPGIGQENLIYVFKVSSLGIVFLFSLALAFGQSFDFKLNQYVLAFYGVNLLFTCVAEQAFFNLLIQANLERIFKFSFRGDNIALWLTAILFSLAHYSAQISLTSFILIGLAGIIYAYLYKTTKCVEIAIGGHFLVNVIHITFFIYPLG